ncbi:hypothetical protein [Tumebacillus permanentifrigoris]|uniref:Phage ABA sandwich domain-containing protein n=1 Tax=Tumebacillus permanentifrigoris TaxID=378543 RepID=A0A316D630_9BACL|nr:hypothetical protein [Tumebacillus permanentifrigoris]PWK10190.1 hypothetical protein C7459_11211 [Tumebacillus permanentifrigoris]
MLTPEQRATFSSKWRSLIDAAEDLGWRVRWRRAPDPYYGGFLEFDTLEANIAMATNGGVWGIVICGVKSKYEPMICKTDSEAIATIRRWLNEAEGYKEGAA